MTSENKPVIKTSLITTDSKILSGYLTRITDSSITLIKLPQPVGMLTSGQYPRAFHYTDIEGFAMRRKGSVGRGALIGAGSGLLIGSLATIISNNSSEPVDGYFSFQIEIPVWQGALAGAVTGAAIGALIGLAHVKFIIKGKKERMAEANSRIIKRFQLVAPGHTN